MRNVILGIAAASLIATPGVFAQTSHAQQNQATTGNQQNMSHAWSEHNERNISSRVDEHVKYLTTVLSLSGEQQQKATDIFTKVANENSSVFKNLKTERKELSAAVEEKEPSSQIKHISDKIGNDVSQLACNVAMAGEQFYQTLNPQQQTKMTQLQNEHIGRMGMAWGA